MSLHKVVRKDGSLRWVARTRVDGAGSKNVARYFLKRSEAESFLSELRNRKRKLKNNGLGVKDFEETTFQAEAEFWLEQNRKNFSAGHMKRVEGILDEVLDRFGHMTPNLLNSERLTLFQSELRKSGLAAATVNRKTEVLTAILNFSLRNRRIPYNPSIGFSKLSTTSVERMQCWEKWECQEFLQSMNARHPRKSSQRWIYLVYKLALNTGLRAGEIWGLQPRDLIQGGQLLYVGRQFDRVKKDFSMPKGKRSRRVPCNESLRRELKHWIDSNALAPSKTIFFNGTGEPVDHDNFIKRQFLSDLRHSSARPIRFHDLRHTAGTLMIDSGVHVTTVKEILGHRDLKTTMNYVHLLGSQIQKVAENFSIEEDPT